MVITPTFVCTGILIGETGYRSTYKLPVNENRKAVFAIEDKAKPSTENIRGSNLAAVRTATVQVTSCRHSIG
jgi:hypothetical protein